MFKKLKAKKRRKEWEKEVKELSNRLFYDLENGKISDEQFIIETTGELFEETINKLYPNYMDFYNSVYEKHAEHKNDVSERKNEDSKKFAMSSHNSGINNIIEGINNSIITATMPFSQAIKPLILSLRLYSPLKKEYTCMEIFDTLYKNIDVPCDQAFIDAIAIALEHIYDCIEKEVSPTKSDDLNILVTSDGTPVLQNYPLIKKFESLKFPLDKEYTDDELLSILKEKIANS